MAVNDELTLPLFVRTIPEIADLLNAEQIEIDLFKKLVHEIEAQLCINSCTTMISRYEQLFAIPANSGLSLQDRRAAVIAKFMTRSPATIKSLESVAEGISHNKCEILENNSDYSFEIIIDRENLMPFDILLLYAKISELKPAHLNFGVRYAKRINVGICLSRKIYQYQTDWCGAGFCGEFPEISMIGKIQSINLTVEENQKVYKAPHKFCGEYPMISMMGKIQTEDVNLCIDSNEYKRAHCMCGEDPELVLSGNIQGIEIPEITMNAVIAPLDYCGTDYCGEE